MKRTALITGASRGIGRAIAERLASEGWSLAVCCRHSGEVLTQLASSLRERYYVDILTYQGDVGEYSFVESMISSALSYFDHLDLLVNNAGVAHIGLLTDLTIEEWNRLIEVNLTSVFSACRCAIPSMVRRKQGHIINISSVWGNTGASCEAAYSACKGGVNALTRALGKELAPSNIQVNAISCGLIDTDMNHGLSQEDLNALTNEIPAGRMGTPEEVAELVLSLSDGHTYLTGQVINLDGGWI